MQFEPYDANTELLYRWYRCLMYLNLSGCLKVWIPPTSMNILMCPNHTTLNHYTRYRKPSARWSGLCSWTLRALSLWPVQWGRQSLRRQSPRYPIISCHLTLWPYQRVLFALNLYGRNTWNELSECRPKISTIKYCALQDRWHYPTAI